MLTPARSVLSLSPAPPLLFLLKAGAQCHSCLSPTLGHPSRPEHFTGPNSCVTAPSSLWSHKTLYSNKIFSVSLRYNLASLVVGGVSVPSPESMLLASGHTMSLYNCNSGSTTLVPQTVLVLCTYELMRQVSFCLISQRKKQPHRGEELEQRLQCQLELGSEPGSGEQHGSCSYPPLDAASFFRSKLRPREDTCPHGCFRKVCLLWIARQVRHSTRHWAPDTAHVHWCVGKGAHLKGLN